MSKKLYILLLLTAAFFTACSTANSIPIDDAYYSPEIESPTAKTTPTSPTSPTSPTIEYLNVQDTTVTIRIK